jgi:hypothetical protein
LQQNRWKSAVFTFHLQQTIGSCCLPLVPFPYTVTKFRQNFKV